MIVFRIFFLFTFFTFLFSCAEKDEPKVPAPTFEKRRLFEIKSIRYIPPNNSFEYYGKIGGRYLEVTLKNVSSFDLDCYYEKRHPHYLYVCDAFINDPFIGSCFFDVDTSRLIKKNEEFSIPVDWPQSLEQLNKHEFQSLRFQILISSSNDLSFYFEDNPNKPWIKIIEGNDHVKKYAYPLEFTYWVPNDIFWEDHLLEHLPSYYWDKNTDDE